MKIAIIGAGLLGRLAALSLSRQGFQLTLFDKDNKNGKQSAAYAAAGLLSPLGESMHCEPNIVEMGFNSLRMWPDILSTLDGYTFFQQEGTVVVSHEQDRGDYQRFVQYLEKKYPQHLVHSLNRQQLLNLEPALGRSFNQGLLLPDEGQIGNRKLLVALERQLELEEISWLCNTEIMEVNNHISHCSLTINNQVQEFDLIIDCRGTGARVSQTNVEPIGDLRAVRGELFQLFAPNVALHRPVRLMHPRYQLYIAPKTKGYYVVGATEIESEDTSSMTVRSAMELLSAAYSVCPGFAEANIRQHVSQLRPAYTDNQPRITIKNNLIQVNGLYRHGFLICPVVIKQLELAVARVLETNQQSGFQDFSTLLPISRIEAN